jgi:xanthine permease XanP
MATGSLDTRKTFIIGTSLLLALSHQVFPAYFAGLPPWLHLLTGSMLSIATLTAIGLNLVFRLGVRRTARLSVAAAASSWEAADQWLRRQGQDWGVGPEDLLRASQSIKAALTLIETGQLAAGPVDIKIGYDELDLVLELSYQDSLVQVPTPPPLPVDFGEQMPFARGLLAAWHCVPPDPLTHKTQGAHCHIRLVF